jgi:hypothetical protein
MRTNRVWMVALALLSAGASPPQEPPISDVVVHEWGTFLAMSGSDGVSLDGMYHEEHALPAFVHARSRDQLRPYSIFLKGETPVIYFYTAKEQRARVQVGFPSGIWTQWYPQAQGIGPALAASPKPGSTAPSNGKIIWHVNIVPASAKVPEPAPPPTSADALWNFARDVDAAYVRTLDTTKPTRVLETERFLFYRGLGTAPLPLRMSAQKGGTLAMEPGTIGVRHVFVLRVEGGKAAYAYRPTLAPGQSIQNVIPSMTNAKPVARFETDIADDLAARLVECGLTKKEARAMVNTWRTSYFGTEGIRTLFVLPQEWTDSFIPMSITPPPKKIVRVMVGRIELLTPERERLAEAAVRDLTSVESSKRLAGFGTLQQQGRYVEPILRRVFVTSKDKHVQTLVRRLLLAGFVTDLKSGLKPALAGKLPEGMTWNEDPLHARARLAVLLREVGLDAEARAEGLAVSEQLAKNAPVPADSCQAHIDLIPWAFALEGRRDDRGAADRYGQLIDLAGLAARREDCRRCHQQTGPIQTKMLPEWWAGESYARAVARIGDLKAAVAEQEATLARSPGDAGALLRIAYLKQALGRPAEARANWSKLEPFTQPLGAALETQGAKPLLQP